MQTQPFVLQKTWKVVEPNIHANSRKPARALKPLQAYSIRDCSLRLNKIVTDQPTFEVFGDNQTPIFND